MKKIKILLVGYSSNLGGMEIYMYNLVKKADKNVFQFDFITMENKKLLYEDELINWGCEVYRVTPRRLNYRKHKDEIKELLQKNNYDYVHWSLMNFGWYEPVVIANKYSRSKIIIHSHTADLDIGRSIITKIRSKFGYMKIRKIPYLKVACGKDAGEKTFKERDFTIFNNGIDLDKFRFNKENREEVRKELGLKESDFVIGLIARLERQKNPLFLIDIFNEIYKKNNKARLVLVGDGSLKDTMIKKIEELKLKEKVIFMGRRNDANKIYSAFDILLMPSLYEGLSIVMVESQVNGLKCYTSKNVDLKSDITGNVNFLSLDVSASEWADFILSQDNRRDEDVLNKIPDEFNAEKSYGKVYEFYKNYIK